MKKFLVTNAAAQDLTDIGRYVSEDNPRAAETVLRGIHSKFSLFCEQPDVGRRRDELIKGLRSFPVDSYIVFYRERGDIIEISRVLHGSRDIPTVFEAAKKRTPPTGTRFFTKNNKD